VTGSAPTTADATDPIPGEDEIVGGIAQGTICPRITATACRQASYERRAYLPPKSRCRSRASEAATGDHQRGAISSGNISKPNYTHGSDAAVKLRFPARVRKEEEPCCPAKTAHAGLSPKNGSAKSRRNNVSNPTRVTRPLPRCRGRGLPRPLPSRTRAIDACYFQLDMLDIRKSLSAEHLPHKRRRQALRRRPGRSVARVYVPTIASKA